MTQYEALLEMIEKAGGEHPNSYVIVDAKTHALLGSGVDPVKLYEKVSRRLEPGQVPVVYKKPSADEILILQDGSWSSFIPPSKSLSFGSQS